MEPFFSRLIVMSGIALAAVGCAQGQNTATKKPAASSAIHYSEGIPNGVKTANGLTVPKGFRVNLFAQGLTNPRRLLIVPGSTAAHYKVLVAESAAGRIRILNSTGNGAASSKSTFATGLNRPYGMAFQGSGFYVGNTNSIVRFSYKNGENAIRGNAREIVKLPASGQHWTCNLLFSRDGKTLYIATGSSCNTCEDKDPHRAAISAIDPDGNNYRVFASGLRNPVGLALQPGSDNLWTSVNERDKLGDDIPSDYATQVQKGAFYGWSYAYPDIHGNVHADPNFGNKNPQKVYSTIPPSVPVQAHSAALGITFYPLGDGQKYFPREYRGDAFLAFHGSWNRSERTGYKIVRVHFENGRPVSVSDFVIGFLKPNSGVTGRPVDVTIAPDGSLLFSDDKNGKIWRVVYVGN